MQVPPQPFPLHFDEQLMSQVLTLNLSPSISLCESRSKDLSVTNDITTKTGHGVTLWEKTILISKHVSGWVVVAHSNPSTWEAEAGRFLIQGQPGLQSKFYSHSVKPSES